MELPWSWLLAPEPSLWTLHLLSVKNSPATPASFVMTRYKRAKEHQTMRICVATELVCSILSVSFICLTHASALLKRKDCGLHVKGACRPYQLLAGQHSRVVVAAVEGVHQ